MMARAKSKKKQSALKVPAIILAIVVVVLFVTAAYRINDYSKGYSHDYDARDYVYSAESGRYDNLYDTAVRDMAKGARYSDSVAECRALAFYYEQAVLEHAYREAGNAEKADAFAARMAEYEAQLGSLSAKAETVRTTVGSAS